MDLEGLYRGRTKDRNGIETIPCTSWENFIEHVRISGTFGERYFRGHTRQEWKLSSPLERLLTFQKERTGENYNEAFGTLDKIKSFQNGYLQRFKEYTVGLPGMRTDILREEDWWALGRHHGLMTPLLDWPRSPYVAAYFAFIGVIEVLSPGFPASYGMQHLRADWSQDVVVWEFNHDANTKKFELEDVLSVFTSRIDNAYRQKGPAGRVHLAEMPRSPRLGEFSCKPSFFYPSQKIFDPWERDKAGSLRPFHDEYSLRLLVSRHGRGGEDGEQLFLLQRAEH
jgi:hypothetical protein